MTRPADKKAQKDKTETPLPMPISHETWFTVLLGSREILKGLDAMYDVLFEAKIDAQDAGEIERAKRIDLMIKSVSLQRADHLTWLSRGLA